MANPEWYTDYVNWYNENMAQHTDPYAQKQFHQYALDYYDQIQNNQKASAAEKERGKAQIAQLAAAVGGPAAYYLANSAAAGSAAAGAGAAGATTGAGAGAASLTGLGASGTTGGATTSAAGTGAATGGGGLGLAGLGAGAGVLGGAYLVGKGVNDLAKGRTDNSNKGKASRAQLAITTGGLSELYRGLGGAQKSTKDYQQERTQGLKESNPGWYDYHTQRLNSDASSGYADKENPAAGWEAGEKWNFDKANQLAQQDGTHFIGTMGNAETFGDDFLRLDQDKQKQISQELANQGLYHSNKGNVLIADDKKKQAQDIYQRIIGGGQ